MSHESSNGTPLWLVKTVTRLEEQAEHLQASVSRMELTLVNINDRFDKVQVFLSAQRVHDAKNEGKVQGGWKVIATVAVIVVGAISMLVNLVQLTRLIGQ